MSRPRKKDTHLPPCVHFQHGAFYYLKRGTWTPLGKSLTVALERYAEIIEGPKGGMVEFVELALPVICRSVKPSTAKQYAIAARKLGRALRQFGPDQVQPKHLAAIKRAMADKPNMANRVLTVARLLFAHALEEQLIAINPAIGVKRHKERKRERLPSAAEYAAVLAKCDARLQAIAELLRFGGQRIVDTLRIRLDDLVAEGLRFRTQKSGKFIVVKWTPGLRAAAERAKALHGPIASMFLLPSKRPGKAPDYRSVKLQWDEACRAAGVADLHLHDLRAMSATQADQEGKSAKDLLTHSSDSTTSRYLRGRRPKLVEGPEF